MMKSNNILIKRGSLVLMLICLVGCVPFNQTISSPVDGKEGTQTLVSRSVLTPALIESSISSGWVTYSVWVSQNPVVSQIFLKNLYNGNVTQLTHTGSNSRPLWSPDGSQIMFLSWTAENSFDIYLMNKDGTNPMPIVAGPAMEMMADWSPDGSKIAYVSNISGIEEIYLLDLQTHVSEKISLASDFTSDFPKWSPSLPKWSPDGRHIAFISGTGTSGKSQVFIMDIDGTNVRQMTDYDLHYDDSPAWCPDSSCIIFTRVEDGPKLMMLSLSDMKTFYLLDSIFSPEAVENGPVRSHDYVTFDVDGVFYAIEIKNMKVYPLGIVGTGASYLSLYP